jgi:serine/threonine protein phosphatase PrpC
MTDVVLWHPQAARLAELAVHLGSSDNITVIVIQMINSHIKETAVKKVQR